MKFRKAALALVLLCSFALANGREVGNGGIAVWKNGKLYLLDLVESGVESAPEFDSGITTDPGVARRIHNVFSGFRVPEALLAQKLTEIRGVDRVFSAALLESMEHYNWQFTSMNLVDIDDDETNLQIPAADRVQLAIRDDKSVMISQKAWNQLNEANQVALLLHEAVYALVPPSESGDGTSTQNSHIARQIVGFLFSPALKTKGEPALTPLLEGVPGGHGENPMGESANKSAIYYDVHMAVKTLNQANFLVDESASIGLSDSSEQSASWVKSVCDDYRGTQDLYLQVEADVNYLQLQFETYPSSNGPESWLSNQEQFGVSIYFSGILSDPSRCEAFVSSLVKKGLSDYLFE